jgi:Zn-dependent protease with chaperone function
MIGFYALAISIVVALGLVVWAEVHYTHRINLKLTLVCVIGAALILWSILPRIDRFEPPGPRLLPSEQPRLFSMIDELARAAGQPMPEEVYLVHDCNAFVTSRGGFLGFFGKRVLGIGLPLLQTLDLAQLRGVLAHEFGHYRGGEVGLGPVIYKTRAAILRTVNNLARGGIGPARMVFVMYAKLYLRVTHAISRAQEYAADAFGASLVGKEPMIRGLETVHSVAPLYDVYLEQELGRVLAAGFRPPVAEGFRRYVTSRGGKELGARILEHQRRGKDHDPYDTHPALPQRVEALETLASRSSAAAEAGPSIELLADLPGLEKRLLDRIVRGDLRHAKPIAWEQVGERVDLESSRAEVVRNGGVLAGHRLADLGWLMASGDELGKGLIGLEPGADADGRRRRFAQLLCSAVVVALAEAGWRIRSEPGEPIEAVRGADVLAVSSLVSGLLDDAKGEAAWRERIDALGIAELPLGAGG